MKKKFRKKKPIRNGGRNGVALTLGFRWAIGKDATVNNNLSALNATELKLKKTKFSLSNDRQLLK